MTPIPTLDIYWRRGCPYCAVLRLTLKRAKVSARWHNIWQDPKAAEFVRSVAKGNETVPTVRFGDEILIAPRPEVVIEMVRMARAVSESGGTTQAEDTPSAI